MPTKEEIIQVAATFAVMDASGQFDDRPLLKVAEKLLRAAEKVRRQKKAKAKRP